MPFSSFKVLGLFVPLLKLPTRVLGFGFWVRVLGFLNDGYSLLFGTGIMV